MTTEEKRARRKLSLLDLAGELGNVSKACKIVGYSRQQFYEIRRNFQTYGAAGLVDRLPGHHQLAPDLHHCAQLGHLLAVAAAFFGAITTTVLRRVAPHERSRSRMRSTRC